MKDGEFGLIQWFRDRAQPDPAGALVLGIGDDCAILRPTPGAELVVTTDMLMDGRHFVLEEHGGAAIGRKAMGVNLSDIAAMAARPIAAVVAVALPKSGDRAVAIAKELHEGLAAMAEENGVAIVGGDTNAWDGPLVVCVTLLGESVGRGVVRRSGAKPGDVVFVTGPLGGSLLGRHLTPRPRIAEALALNAAAPLHALIDISDGLAADLGHILEESGNLGAILEESAVPIHPDVDPRDGRSALTHALGDGEDFELIVVMDRADADRLERKPPSPAVLYRIGWIEEQPGLFVKTGRGALLAIEPAGFDHLRSK
jgi:thiamine-monophosphate kinase